METFDCDLMLNEVDLDMNWDFDLGNKEEYAWDKSNQNSHTTEEVAPPQITFDNPNTSAHTWAFYDESSDFSSS
ncbi:MAG: hypothetical protein V2I33_21660 [Kangiellaceae bacterium]|jgi:hypothetical protein|nr:hypothetical protein [Kangiellaceae bacterium]